MIDRPLTKLQQEALLMAEETLFNDTKLVEGYGRQLHGLRLRGLVEGEKPHVYLTDAGRQMLVNLECEMAAFNRGEVG